MSLIEYWREFVMTPPKGRRWYQIVAWWEARRLAYNVLAGIVAVVTATIVSLVPEIVEEPDSPLFGAIVFLMTINVFYTMGWVVELSWCLLSQSDTPDIAPVLLKFGLLLTVITPVLLLSLSALSSLV